jgi:hypothetical protein
VTDGTEDLSDPEGTEPAAQAPLDGWGSTSAEPAWTSIAQEGESLSKAEPNAAASDEPAAPVAANEPAASSGNSEAGGSNPYAAIPPAETPKPAGRGRRPSSLRVGQDEFQTRAAPTPPPVSPPPFAPAAAPREAAELPPAEPSDPAGPSLGARATELSQQFVALTQDRPEIGLAVAFVGGLVLATIFKRLGRK